MVIGELTTKEGQGIMEKEMATAKARDLSDNQVRMLAALKGAANEASLAELRKTVTELGKHEGLRQMHEEYKEKLEERLSGTVRVWWGRARGLIAKGLGINESRADMLLIKSLVASDGERGILESSGMVRIDYSPIRVIKKAPEEWVDQGGDLREWKHHLVCLADHFRLHGAVILRGDELSELNLPMRFIAAPDDTAALSAHMRLPSELDRIAVSTYAAWAELRKLMRNFSDGYQLDLAYAELLVRL